VDATGVSDGQARYLRALSGDPSNQPSRQEPVANQHVVASRYGEDVEQHGQDRRQSQKDSKRVAFKIFGSSGCVEKTFEVSGCVAHAGGSAVGRSSTVAPAHDIDIDPSLVKSIAELFDKEPCNVGCFARK
jgi:hypothetical protein